MLRLGGLAMNRTSVHWDLPKLTLSAIPCSILLLTLCGAQILHAAVPGDLDRYNVIWTTPSKDSSGSMPIGNGEVGLNLWVETGGDLVFYISRTDAWSEVSRLLKLGRVRVHIAPNPFVEGSPFRQELRLREGCIEIAAGAKGNAVRLKIFVDADAPVIHISGASDQPITLTASFENWRTQKKVLTGDELLSSWTMQNPPTGIEVWESADVVPAGASDEVWWHHRNAYSIVPFTLKHQGLDPFSDQVKDPLLNRTFGGRMVAAGFRKDGNQTLRSASPVRHFTIQITTHSAQTATPEAWEKEVASIAARSRGIQASAASTAAWWRGFWDRSWIFVEGDPIAQGKGPISPVTQAYVLQRWMTACAGRGNFPIKFNGSIFTVDPEFTGGPKMNADWRKWGDCYWWQNTRLPYFPMPARGDFDQLAPLFRMYREAMPLARARTKAYHATEGIYFPETMTIFGTFSNRDYGWDRTGHQPNEMLNLYIRHIWQQGLELCALMLDTYDHTLDARFLREELVPMAHDVLRYFDARFKRDAGGKLIIEPTQSVETYWYGVSNDSPNVAGLIYVLDRLLALKVQVPQDERAYWQKLKAAVPDLPLSKESGMTRVLPAERFDPKRSNVENPELYAIWPFQLLGVGRPDIEIGIETFKKRQEKSTVGWSYDAHCAALLGLTDEAERQLVLKARNANPNHRFPAMWGPNYDWLPDQDHGSALMLTLQYMLLQTVGEKIYLLPAWPRDWNAKFKLHAPGRTVLEGEVKEGKLTSLEVTPKSRRKDVVTAR
jgi:hypothetical protein